jgi:glycosyltransferase involved in cell wall biosynthesis
VTASFGQSVDTGCDAETAHSIAVCVPSYNNAGTIGSVIEGALKYCRNIIAIDDGSNDATHRVLSSFPGITVIRFMKNRGKGAALDAAIKQAVAMGVTHIITMDGDGQHLAEDIPLFIDKIKLSPQTLWIGRRVIPCKGTSQPARSRIGRRFGNFWYRFITGIRIHDTQCGFRVYPARAISRIRIRGHRYEYEQDALIKAAWSGIPVSEVDIHLNYPGSVSHFRPVVDFLRISAVNSRAAFLRVIFPVLTFEAAGNTIREKIATVIKYELKAHTTPARAAFSLALGVFIGIFPIHGLQVFTLMALSLVMKLNRPLAFLGVCISSPPLLPFIIVAAVATGRMVVPDLSSGNDFSPALKTLFQGGAEFVVGSIILSVLAGIAVFLVAFPVFRKMNDSRKLGKTDITQS